MSTTAEQRREAHEEVLALAIARVPKLSDSQILERVVLYGPPYRWGRYQHAVVDEAKRRGLR